MTGSNPQVFIVDDDDSVCRALTRLIQSAGYRVKAFSQASEFLDELNADMCPACLVLDMQLPDRSGLDLQRELDARLPIIFLTGHGNIAMTVAAMKAGATDFLSKPVHDIELLRAIEHALERAEHLHAVQCRLAGMRRCFERLTPREREVMALIVTGRLNKQVADMLGTGEKNIKAHRARLMRKMEVTSLAQLVLIADRLGLCRAFETDASDAHETSALNDRRITTGSYPGREFPMPRAALQSRAATTY
jgi:FixJ family two-component response regulator